MVFPFLSFVPSVAAFESCCFNSRLCRHLSLVLFYLDENSIQDYESDEKFSISDDRISHLLPTSYQDMIVRVYSKKPELVCGKKKMLFWFHHNFSLHPLYSGLHFLFQYNVTGWSNFRGFWKFSGEDLWNQGTSTRYTREENKAKVVLSLGAYVSLFSS